MKIKKLKKFVLKTLRDRSIDNGKYYNSIVKDGTTPFYWTCVEPFELYDFDDHLVFDFCLGEFDIKVEYLVWETLDNYLTICISFDSDTNIHDLKKLL